MGDGPIDRVDRHRDEGVIIPRVEGDKKEKEKFKHLPSEDEELMRATFFSYLKKLFDAFSPSKKIAGKVIDLRSIIQHLEQFQTLLQKLETKDLSNSSDYAQELSEAWSKLVEDFEHIEIIERKNLAQVANFREMMDTIKHYPPKSEHRFGYYLLEQAGKDWLPFPFIEILEGLYRQHQADPNISTLAVWHELIEGVIKNLKDSLKFKP